MTLNKDAKSLKIPSTDCVTLEEGLEIAEKLKAVAAEHKEALGLSAVQIGIHKRVFVFKLSLDVTSQPEPNKWVTVINPVLGVCGTVKSTAFEGCLSFPGTFVQTERLTEVSFTGLGHDAPFSLTLKGLDAIVFQHELDHLDGVLFYERGKIVKCALGRNDKCLCGSEKKFKKCHGANL